MNPPRIRDVGDAALLLELEAVIDVSVNAQAIAIAAFVRKLAIPGVRDVVPTYRSVAVYFDPLVADALAMRRALERACEEAPANASGGRTVVIPVIYGGEYGPDINAVAEFAGVSADTVAQLHAERAYHVFMLGFLPGFAYMGIVDEPVAMPRHATPRLRVPGGSVGIAGRQTGVYPRESPGGWQIIGRTPLVMFDPRRTPAALVSPGDTVHFVGERLANVGAAFGVARAAPTAGASGKASTTMHQPSPVNRYVTVTRPGLFTTIQDSGRWGHQHIGVPVGGAMDSTAYRVANALVGNDQRAAALEVTLTGPELRIDDGATVAVTGADLEATVDGVPFPQNTPRTCSAGSTLRFGRRRGGARAYVAFAGGIAVAPALGSRASHVRSGLGANDGRPLIAGDRLPLGEPLRTAARQRYGSQPAVDSGARLRILPGPQDDQFSASTFDVLTHTRFTIGAQSDRMGYRLTGGRLPDRANGEMISDATFIGAIQVPPSGEPILLMADRQTSGGYPQIAIVITADQPIAGQLAPGDWVEFQLCTRGEALAALLAEEGRLLAVQ